MTNKFLAEIIERPMYLVLTLIALALLPSISNADFNFKVIERAETKQNAKEVYSFLNDLKSQLPEKVRSTITKDIIVNFTTFSGRELIDITKCDPNIVVQGGEADTKHSTISLNLGYINVIRGGEANAPKYNCGMKNLFRQAQATVLHEVAHIYDAIQFTAQEKEFVQVCSRYMSQGLDHRMTLEQKKHCMYLRTRDGLVSDRNEYLAVAGFKNADTSKNTAQNFEVNRLTMAYEQADVYEHFAVNFAYWLLDKEYFCRRPVLHNFFTKYFSHNIEYMNGCRPMALVRNEENAIVENIDPDQVVEIHLLKAGKGEAMMSRFGHAMLRLVMCDAEKLAPGEIPNTKCRNHLAYNLVISHLAIVESFTMDTMKGLTGKYPAKINFLNFLDVINNYAYDETRSLISIPLKLTKEQKAQIIYAALEQYWEYRGRYSFFKNNCATETRDLLRASLNVPELFQSTPISPQGVLELLDRSHLLAGEEDAQGAIRKLVKKDFDRLNRDEEKILRERTYLVEGVWPRLEKAYAQLKPFVQKTVQIGTNENGDVTLKRYLGESNATLRLQLFNSLRGQGSAQFKALAAMNALEGFVLQNRLQKYNEKLGELIQLNLKEGNLFNSDIKAKLYDYIKSVEAVQYASAGYGIPMREELTKSFLDESDVKNEKDQMTLKMIRELLRPQLADVITEIEQTEKNMTHFSVETIRLLKSKK